MRRAAAKRESIGRPELAMTVLLANVGSRPTSLHIVTTTSSLLTMQQKQKTQRKMLYHNNGMKFYYMIQSLTNELEN